MQQMQLRTIRWCSNPHIFSKCDGNRYARLQAKQLWFSVAFFAFNYGLYLKIVLDV